MDAWENEVIAIVANELDLARGDAQCVVEGQPFIMQQAWGMGLDPFDAAMRVING